MDGNNSTEASNLPDQQVCRSGFPSRYFHSNGQSTAYYANCVINSLFSLLTTLASGFILISLRKMHSLRKPSKLLVGSVFFAEVGIGALAQPAFAVFQFTKATDQRMSSMACVAVLVTNLSASILGCGCLLTLTAVCVDRYVALFHFARYRTLVTTTRVATVLVFLWSLSIACGSSYQWCSRCYYPFSIAVLTFALGLTSFCYFRIYGRLKHRQVQIANTTARRASTAVNISVYRTSILNLLAMHGLLLLGYAPYLCAVLVFEIGGFTVARVTAIEFTLTLVLSRSALNSVMCCWSIREVRAQLSALLCPCCPSQSSP